MRDLERLRERSDSTLPRGESAREPRSDDTAGRRFGLFALAGMLSVAGVISYGVMRGGPQELAPPKPDPLAQLALPSADPKDLRAQEAQKRDDSIELAHLSFPATLVGEEGPTRVDTARLPRRVQASDVPASTLAGEQTERLQRATRHDPLMAQAMPERTGAVAPLGSEGAFTLQVVSFQTRDPAERFVNALRARGHRAFLSQTELPGRGRSFRVRVGPFTTRRDVLAYQKSFEETERMHGIVVMGANN